MRSVRTMLAVGVTTVGVLSSTGSAFAAESPVDGLLQTVQSATGQVTQTVTQATAPVTQAVAPVTKPAEQAPQAQAPAAQQPAAQAPAPAADVVEQVKTAAAPVLKAAEPVTKAVKPVTDALKPITDAAGPVTKPVTDAAKPAMEGTAPAVDAAKPVTDAAAPVTKAVEPVTKALAPVTKVVNDTVGKLGVQGLPGTSGRQSATHTASRAQLVDGLGGGGDILSDNEIGVEVGDVLSDNVRVDVVCNALAVIGFATACGDKGGKGKDKDDEGKARAYSAAGALGGGGDIGSDNEVGIEIGDVLSDNVTVDVLCNAIAVIGFADAPCGKGRKGKDDHGKASAYRASGGDGDGGGDIVSDNEIGVVVGDVLSDNVSVDVVCNALAVIGFATACGKDGHGDERADLRS